MELQRDAARNRACARDQDEPGVVPDAIDSTVELLVVLAGLELGIAAAYWVRWADRTDRARVSAASSEAPTGTKPG
jgi:hypothetical protein